MAPIPPLRKVAPFTVSSSGGESPDVTDPPRVIDLNDARNFAADRPVRSSRNSAPIYALVEHKKAPVKTGRIMKNATAKKPARKVQVFKKKRTFPKKLTPRRQEIIYNFLHQVLPNPTQFGPVGGDRWNQELIRILGEPPSKGKQKLAPITPEDVNNWLNNAQFEEVLTKIKKKATFASSSSAPALPFNDNRQRSSKSTAASAGEFFSKQTPGSSRVSPTSSMASGSIKSSDYDDQERDNQQQVISTFKSEINNSSQTNGIAGTGSFDGQFSSIITINHYDDDGYGEQQSTGGQNHNQTFQSVRASLGNFTGGTPPLAIGYNNSIPPAAAQELRNHSNSMVRIYNEVGNAGYANNPTMAVFRHQLNAIQDLLFYFMGGNEQ